MIETARGLSQEPHTYWIDQLSIRTALRATTRWARRSGARREARSTPGEAPRAGGGLFAGTSSGANVVAAVQVAERLGPGTQVVTLMVDSGPMYVSTDVYRSR